MRPVVHHAAAGVLQRFLCTAPQADKAWAAANIASGVRVIAALVRLLKFLPGHFLLPFHATPFRTGQALFSGSRLPGYAHLTEQDLFEKTERELEQLIFVRHQGFCGVLVKREDFLKSWTPDEIPKAVHVVAAHVEELQATRGWLTNGRTAGALLDDNIPPLPVHGVVDVHPLYLAVLPDGLCLALQMALAMILLDDKKTSSTCGQFFIRTPILPSA